jgi:DNA-directed RNA polymerase subunit RPC12/RpoP
MAKADGPRRVCCYHCGHDLEISGRAMSISCPECNLPVLLEDIKVKGYMGVHVLETCGRLWIPKRKHVVVQGHVVAHAGIQVDGKLWCEKAISRGPVVLGPKANWRGDLRAPSLEVRLGATIDEGYFSIPEDPIVP